MPPRITGDARELVAVVGELGTVGDVSEGLTELGLVVERGLLGEDPAHDVAHGVTGGRAEEQMGPEELFSEAQEEVEALNPGARPGVDERPGGLLSAADAGRVAEG